MRKLSTDVIAIADLTDLPNDKPLLLYGICPKTLSVKEGIEVLGNHEIHDFCERESNPCLVNNLISKSIELYLETQDQFHLVICREYHDSDVTYLKSIGWKNLFSTLDYSRGIRRMPFPITEPIILPEVSTTLLNEEQSSTEQIIVKANGARFKAEFDIPNGCKAIRDICYQYGAFHPFDDVTKSAFLETGAFDYLVHIHNIAVQRFNLDELKHLANKQEDKNQFPPILINTMIKSGTGFLTQTLKEKFDLPQYFVSMGGSPNVFLIPELVARFAKGGAFSVQHLNPSPETLDILAENGISKIYLHVRDPRQATVSYLYHLENNLKDSLRALRHWVQPHLPENYESFHWEQKIEWQSYNHYPNLISWVQKWLVVSKNDNRFDIKIGEFQDFASDEVSHINDLLAFYQVPEKISESDLPAKTSKLHFRSGRSNEWKEIFNDQQIEFMNAFITPEMQEKFGWLT